jgi:hypothetical protein
MTERPVMAEIALTTVFICFPLFRIFEAHRGSNIRKAGKQKYRRDQKQNRRFLRHGGENAGYTTNEMGTPRASEVCEEFTHLGS